MKKIICLLFIFFANSAISSEVKYMGRSPYGLLMGDAYTTLAYDNYTLFYNPAIMGENNGMSLTPLPLQFAVTNPLGELDRFKSFPSNDPAKIADRILGFPLYIQAAGYPTLKFGPFALSAIFNNENNIVLRNAVNPTLDIDHRYDRGFVLGAGFNLGPFKKKTQPGKKESGGSGMTNSIGFSFKHFNRQALSNNFNLFGAKLLNIVTNSGASDYNAVMTQLGMSTGDAWGFDMGYHGSMSSGASTLRYGLAISDVAGSNFTLTSGTKKVAKQPMIVSSGVSFSQDFMLFDYKLALDLHPLTSSIDFTRKIHLGIDVGLPFLRFLAGINAGYLNYGGEVHIWPFKILAGFYNIEVGRDFRQEASPRALIYVSLLDFSFNM